MVYKTTPRGNRKQAASVGMPVRDVTTAEPPTTSIKVTRMLVNRPKQMKTQCVKRPGHTDVSGQMIWMGIESNH